MDDVRIYQRALSQAKIQSVMVDSANSAPSFTSNPINKPSAVAGKSYSSSIAGDAMDPNPGDTLTFSKLSGPAAPCRDIGRRRSSRVELERRDCAVSGANECGFVGNELAKLRRTAQHEPARGHSEQHGGISSHPIAVS
jgi:hypothetical protein